MRCEIDRLIRILFGDPFATPTFDEYAMFFAFAAALRSGDLSRQVGAVIAKYKQILAHGANDCPQSGGGLYWAEKDQNGAVSDMAMGRDFKREFSDSAGNLRTGHDSNSTEKRAIIDKIVKAGRVAGLNHDVLQKVLEDSPVDDLTEYGRVVHAEMEALLSCARVGIGTKDATLYSTTFPCHNCAKHIIAAGITKVVYIEPYTKSKALDFHEDAIHLGFKAEEKHEHKVLFSPYVGVGPRRFFDLFSYRHGSGKNLKRKDPSGFANHWSEAQAKPRLYMNPFSYLELECIARDEIDVLEQQKQARSDLIEIPTED